MSNSLMISHLRQILHGESLLRRHKIDVDVEGNSSIKKIVLAGRVSLYYQKQVAQSLVKRYIDAHRMNGLAAATVTIENNLRVD